MSSNLNDLNQMKPEILKKVFYAYYKDNRFDLFRSYSTLSVSSVKNFNHISSSSSSKMDLHNPNNNLLNNDLLINKITLRNKYKEFQIPKTEVNFQIDSLPIQPANDEKKPIQAMILKKQSNRKKNFSIAHNPEHDRLKNISILNSKISNQNFNENQRIKKRDQVMSSCSTVFPKSTRRFTTPSSQYESSPRPSIKNKKPNFSNINHHGVRLKPIDPNLYLKNRFLDLSYLLND